MAKTMTIGTTVRAIVWAWSETENPTSENFHTSRILEFVKRGKHSVYVRMEGLTKLIPIDRVSIV